jgi:hypothetical protein
LETLASAKIFNEATELPFLNPILDLYAAETGVSVINYGWGMPGIPLCEKRGAAHQAFYFYSDAISFDPRFKARAFTRDLPESMSDEARETALRLIEAIDYGSVTSMQDFLSQPKGNRRIDDYAIPLGIRDGGLAVLRLSAWNEKLGRESWFEKLFPEVVALSEKIQSFSDPKGFETKAMERVQNPELPLIDLFREMKPRLESLSLPTMVRVEK